MSANGAFYVDNYLSGIAANIGGSIPGRINLSASLSNAIYGNSTTVQPPAITLIPQIKY